ncbi:hypothetical protein RRG08_032655 [Elysia crispata]|uniref:Trans-1,2-dihydrobenzene-1,2-diol dehydrogenase n=1 Tax=Elysia crispata TaxID=231223 RepID=A0AAE1CQ16_9GAST|nr:hypothetical protein RRG08_032655 [Elysia crispata]
MAHPTRWGICGAGNMANELCVCLESLPSEHKIVAVAARDKSKAETFAKCFSIPLAYGSYDELATNPEIDAVYIATVPYNHVELSLRFINAGKAVLCEKPMSLSLEGCKRVLQAAREKGVLFVEGFWSLHFPLYKFLREKLDSGVIGEVVMVEAALCASFGEDRYLGSLELGGGALKNMGCYPIMIADYLFPNGPPETISAVGNVKEGGVDRSGVICIKYPGDKLASLTFSNQTHFGFNRMTIRGTKGLIMIPDFFWSPTKIILPDNEEKTFELPKVNHPEKFRYFCGEGLTYQIQNFRECLLKGLVESPNVTHKTSESISYITQEVLNQLGVKFTAP